MSPVSKEKPKRQNSRPGASAAVSRSYTDRERLPQKICKTCWGLSHRLHTDKCPACGLKATRLPA